MIILSSPLYLRINFLAPLQNLQYIYPPYIIDVLKLTIILGVIGFLYIFLVNFYPLITTLLIALIPRTLFGLSNIPAQFGDAPNLRLKVAELLLSGYGNLSLEKINRISTLQSQYLWPGSWILDGIFTSITKLDFMGIQFLLSLFDVFFCVSIYILGKKLFGKRAAIMSLLLLSIAPLSMGYRWYSAQLYVLILFFFTLIILLNLPLYNNLGVGDKKTYIIILIFSTSIFISHSVTSIIYIIMVSGFLYFFNLYNKKTYITFLMMIFIMWNLFFISGNIREPYVSTLFNYKLSFLIDALIRSTKPIVNSSLPIPAQITNPYRYLIYYRYLFYAFIFIVSILTLIKYRYYKPVKALIKLALCISLSIPFLSAISGNFIFRLLTHFGLPLASIFISFHISKKFSNIILYLIPFLLILSILSSIAGISIYKEFSATPTEMINAKNIYPYLPERFTAFVSGHFYSYCFGSSIITNQTQLITNPGYFNLQKFYSRSE